jgi:hypothetical protein
VADVPWSIARMFNGSVWPAVSWGGAGRR